MQHDPYPNDPEIAGQLRKPEGKLSAWISGFMNRNNRTMYKFVLSCLNPEAGSKILEIGPGDGHFIPDILKLAPEISYSAIDHSLDMVLAIEDKKKSGGIPDSVNIFQADSLHLEYIDSRFDQVLALNVIYFWPDLEKQFLEFHRVLKPGATLVVGFRSEESMKHLPFTQHGFIFRNEGEILHALHTAGFKKVEVIKQNEEIRTLEGLTVILENICLKACK